MISMEEFPTMVGGHNFWENLIWKRIIVAALIKLRGSLSSILQKLEPWKIYRRRKVDTMKSHEHAPSNIIGIHPQGKLQLEKRLQIVWKFYNNETNPIHIE